MVLVPDGGYDPGRASHAVLLELRRSVQRHPGVTDARGVPDGQFTRVRAAVDPADFGDSADSGTLTVRWFAGESVDAPPEFSFHYSGADGFDCGWHREPNPHVEGCAHYQERPSPDAAYTYRELSFESEEPVRVLWGVLDRLQTRLQRRESG